MFVPHKFVSLSLNEYFNIFEAATEAIEYSAYVSSFFHRDNTRVIFLVYPYEEVFVIVVPDSTRVWPVACHTRAREQRGNWFVKQEVIVDQLLLLGRGHTVQRIVAARQVAWKPKQLIHQFIFVRTPRSEQKSNI